LTTGIETGDGAALNGPQIQVSNAVYNKIRSDTVRKIEGCYSFFKEKNPFKYLFIIVFKIKIVNCLLNGRGV
jgi:hypothetical protein